MIKVTYASGQIKTRDFIGTLEDFLERSLSILPLPNPVGLEDAIKIEIVQREIENTRAGLEAARDAKIDQANAEFYSLMRKEEGIDEGARRETEWDPSKHRTRLFQELGERGSTDVAVLGGSLASKGFTLEEDEDFVHLKRNGVVVGAYNATKVTVVQLRDDANRNLLEKPE